MINGPGSNNLPHQNFHCLKTPQQRTFNAATHRAIQGLPWLLQLLETSSPMRMSCLLPFSMSLTPPTDCPYVLAASVQSAYHFWQWPVK